MLLDQEGVWPRIILALDLRTAPQVARKLNITKQAVYEWQKGKMPGLDTLARIAEISKVSLHWLLTGQGDKNLRTRSVEPLKDNIQEYIARADLDPRIRRSLMSELIFSDNIEREFTELLSESVSKRHRIAEGITLVFFGEQTPGLVPVRLWGDIVEGKVHEPSRGTVLIAENFARVGGDKFVLRVRDDSMSEDDIRDDDLIIFTKSPKAKSEDIVIALIADQRAVVRKLHRAKHRVKLMPTGERRQPAIISDIKIEILGKVIGIQRES